MKSTGGRWWSWRVPWLVIPGVLLLVWAGAGTLGFVHRFSSAAAAGIMLLYLPALIWFCVSRNRDDGWERHLQDEAQRRFVAIADTSGELVWEIDREGRILYIGPLVMEFLGYEPGEVIGKPVATLLPDFEHARAAALAAEHDFPAHGWQDMLWTYRHRSGELRPYMSTAVAHADSTGRATGYAGTLRRPELVESELLLNELRDRISDVLMLDQLAVHFQPIRDTVSGTVIGAESLARFSGGDPSRTPDVWFADAAAVGLGADLELHAIRTALCTARQLPPDIYVSINLSPATLLTGRLADVVAESGWHPARLVLEITEHVSVADYGALSECIAGLRTAGMRLAVDDAGAGYASFRHILALAPDYIKLDRTLVAEVDTDPSRQALVRAMMIFAGEVGATVVAEGVETEAELATARRLGVQAAQGFLTGRPAPAAEWPVAVTVDQPHPPWLS